MHYIGLLDCNNFFVSCERLFRPDLAKKPVAVLSSNDGCIVARSNEVKAMGIPMGLPLFQAKQLVDMSQVTLFSSNFTLYRDISSRVMQVLKEEVDDVDVYSVDEAFFALQTTSESELMELRTRVMKKTGIPVSIGVAATKTLAKEASEIGKRGNGVCLLTPELWNKQAPKTPCSDIWGLGRATTQKLAELGIKSAADFLLLDRSFVRRRFGVGGERIYDELCGTRVYKLDSEHLDETRQSTTSSRSFASTTHDRSALESAVAYHVAEASRKIRERGLVATVLYVELRAGRHNDFSHRGGAMAVPLEAPTNDTLELTKTALQTIASIYDSEVPYKKAGVTLGSLIPEKYTAISLFADETTTRTGTISGVLDAVQKRFGSAALHSAAILPTRDRSSAKLRSRAYTTSWKDIPTIRA